MGCLILPGEDSPSNPSQHQSNDNTFYLSLGNSVSRHRSIDDHLKERVEDAVQELGKSGYVPVFGKNFLGRPTDSQMCCYNQ